MKKLQVSIHCVYLLPKWAWTEYTVQNDQHGRLIALVSITDHYAELIEKAPFTADEAVEAIYRGGQE